MECVFCEKKSLNIDVESELSFVIFDSFPVTANHTLIIPKRHVSDAFALTPEELIDLFNLANSGKDRIQSLDSKVKGFNLGFNIGEVSGQTIFHAHLHLIPRRANDVINPRGGIRNVIPGKGDYKIE